MDLFNPDQKQILSDIIRTSYLYLTLLSYFILKDISYGVNRLSYQLSFSSWSL